MSEKRFVQLGDTSIKDTLTGEEWYAPCEYSLLDLLNEQEATIRKLQDLCGESDYENAKLRQEIKELKAKLREKEEDERLYANEIVKLNKEAKEVLDFKSLGGDY